MHGASGSQIKFQSFLEYVFIANGLIVEEVFEFLGELYIFE